MTRFVIANVTYVDDPVRSFRGTQFLYRMHQLFGAVSSPKYLQLGSAWHAAKQAPSVAAAELIMSLSSHRSPRRNTSQARSAVLLPHCGARGVESSSLLTGGGVSVARTVSEAPAPNRKGCPGTRSLNASEPALAWSCLVVLRSSAAIDSTVLLAATSSESHTPRYAKRRRVRRWTFSGSDGRKISAPIARNRFGTGTAFQIWIDQQRRRCLGGP